MLLGVNSLQINTHTQQTLFGSDLAKRAATNVKRRLFY